MSQDWFKDILKNTCTVEGEIYNCLPVSQELDEVKKTEIATYSERAAKFKTADIVKLSSEENNILKPIRDLGKDKIILEIGGGDGRFALALLKEGYQVIESDIAPGTVKRSCQLLREQGIKNGKFAAIDAENLPFRDQSLNIIFMVAAFHHLPDPKKAVAEFCRVLKPQGLLLILHEPASWQYYVFYPVFKILRWVIRRRSHHAISLADDQTFGWSPRKFRRIFGDKFTMVEFKPLDYWRKWYTNWLALRTKLKGKIVTANPKTLDRLRRFDHAWSKIPGFRSLPWDWDVLAWKK